MDKEKEIREYIKNRNLASAQTRLIEELEETINNYYKKNYRAKDNINLAHYTTIGTIQSILQGQKEFTECNTETESKKKIGNKAGLRLYNSSSFNDPDEGSYLKENLIKHWSFLSGAKEPEAFICSFVGMEERKLKKENRGVGDKLIYWKPYGNDGLGCSICPGKDFYTNNKNYLKKVLYGERSVNSLKKHFHIFLELGQLLYEEYKKTNGKESKILPTKFWEPFHKVRFLYKNEDYQYEHEYRMIITPKSKSNSDITFDLQNDPTQGPHIRKFINTEKLHWREILSSQSEVFIGPRVVDKKLIRKHLDDFAYQVDILGPDFKISNVRYRNYRKI